MKSIIKGMTLLLAGASFVACSKDVAFDENAQKEAKAQAELQQKFATYESKFVSAFGAIASNHQWGFDQTAVVTTRGAVIESDLEWYIPESFRTPSQNKEGINANTIAANLNNLTKTLSGFNFNNYWLQHVDKGKHHTDAGRLQAYDQTNGWVDVTNFTGGDNPNGTFKCDNINSYIGKKSLQSTTLMTNMGTATEPGTGYQFRFGSDNNWSYDYYFFNYNNSTFLCLKHIWTNGNGKKQETCWWIIRIGEAEAITNNTKYRGRVMCEDMGSMDFDFNDVVFDAEIDKNNNIDITVVAAGGTLPIYIGGSPENGGVKVTMGEMVNTGENNGVTPQTIHFDAVNGSPKFASIHAIPVWVDPGGEAIPYELTAESGKSPQKICTYLLTSYPDEYIRIDKAYNNFTEWVNNEDPQKWSNHVNWWLVDLVLSNNKGGEPDAQ